MGGRYCAINSPLGPRWGQKSLDLRSRDFWPHLEPRGELIAQYRPPMSFRYIISWTYMMLSKYPIHSFMWDVHSHALTSQSTLKSGYGWVIHDDVLQWKHFPRYWPLVRGIHRSPVNSAHKGQWHGALMFLWSAPWISGWVNIREGGDLRRHRVHNDVIVMHIPQCMWMLSITYA